MEAVREANERLQRDPHAPSKTPLSFYGQVVDEQDQPLAGVQVELNWPNPYTAGSYAAQRTSDAQGRFSLVGEHGERLKTYLNKPGYYVPDKVKGTSFEFFQPGNEEADARSSIHYYEPDEAHPFVFRLHKKGGSSKLIHKVVRIKPPVDGTTVSFDFVRGVLVKEGSGQMSIQTWKKVDAFPPLDWRVVLNILGGGFREDGAKEEFAFQAPYGGYEPTRDWSLRMTGGLAGGNGTLLTHLFFCYGKPECYGRVQLATEATSQSVELDYVLNPTPGDRNLEYNPEAAP